MSTSPDWKKTHQEMIKQLHYYGVKDPVIIEAMSRVRRHAFIPGPSVGCSSAYGDHPCAIGFGQTISQPYIVAYMTEKLKIQPGDLVLEIGTGSGYQAAVLAECGADVYSIEIIPELADHARKALESEGYSRVHVLIGDGYKGWPEYSPYDAIIGTCASESVPEKLIDQLKNGGRMILPLGGRGIQYLAVITKQNGKIHELQDLAVRFVPMVGGGEWQIKPEPDE